MPQTIVLVTFYSRSGATETLALSHAVGAVQARSLIRLRRVTDINGSAGPAASPDQAEAIQRMHKEYVPPAEADLLNADAIVVAPPPDSTPTGTEWEPFVTLIRRLGADGRLAGKVGAVVSTGDERTTTAFTAALLGAGLVVVPPVAGEGTATPAAATAHGRRVAAMARAVKSADNLNSSLK